MIRVLIAEDQAMVRGALKALLAMEGDIEIVAETDRADEVLALALLCAENSRRAGPSFSRPSGARGSCGAPWRTERRDSC